MRIVHVILHVTTRDSRWYIVSSLLHGVRLLSSVYVQPFDFVNVWP